MEGKWATGMKPGKPRVFYVTAYRNVPTRKDLKIETIKMRRLILEETCRTAFAPNGCFAMSTLYMNGFMSIAQSCSNHEKRRDFEKCITHSFSEFPVTDNLNEMLQLLVAPSKTSAVFYRGFYVLLPELMYALLGTFGAKLSSDSASAAVVSSSLGSTSAVSQSASSADVSSSEFDSVGASSSRAC